MSNKITAVLESKNVKGVIETGSSITVQVQNGIKGKSAYESWLDQGNIGSEQDFIAALLVNTNFTFTQVNPETEWTIVHNLNKYPSVAVVDSGGSVVYGNVVYNSVNQITLSFNAGFSGKAYLN